MNPHALPRSDWRRALASTETTSVFGLVQRISAMHIEASGPTASLGALCMVGDGLMAEVSSVSVGRVTLVPYGALDGIRVGDRVELRTGGATVGTGPAVLGRVMNALGQPIDDPSKAIDAEATWPLAGVPSSPLNRVTPTIPLETGIRAIDGLLTLGRGQRIGIFAGSGVGKSTLLSSLSRHMRADVLILCLVGERGREAQDFWLHALDEDARSRATMIVSTSDEPAVMRARSVHAALAHAEYFRANGKHVLLLLDSVTRYALALREIGLASGEPPTVRSYTPSVFAALPKVVERCGALDSGGAITSVMTVLTETDDVDDPMAETLRALLDGHIVLSRTLAEQGHFPAIDVPRSVSRVFQRVNDDEACARAMDAIAQLSLYESSRTLVESGLYAGGTNAALDRVLERRGDLLGFLRQAAGISVSAVETRATLAEALGATP